MIIDRLIVHNFKLFKDLDIEFNEDINIFVGNNEAGKSTLLESINLALTKCLNGKSLETELTGFIFNSESVSEYLVALREGKHSSPPNIYIEVYFKESEELNHLRGTNNSINEDRIGIRLEVLLNDRMSEYFAELLADDSGIPVECFSVSWNGFDGNSLINNSQSIPKPSYIDTTLIRLQNGTDQYLQNILKKNLTDEKKVKLAISYRRLKEGFSADPSIKQINEDIKALSLGFTNKKLSIALDTSQRSKWETNIIPHLNDLPLTYAGMGEQNSIKILLALESKLKDQNIIIVEEPENHLSFSKMRALINRIIDKCSGKQIFITTHSSYILNKLGLNNLILINSGHRTTFKALTPETQEYFQKLAGYDTLRLVLSNRSLLVEGPSDELIVQKAYTMLHNGKLPLDDEIDIICVGLSFPRFLEIAKNLKKKVAVIRDNDHRYIANVQNNYSEFKSEDIQIYSDSNDDNNTLEPSVVAVNSLEVLNKVFEKAATTKAELIEYLRKNKTECALAFFRTSEKVEIPKHINEAINFVTKE